MPIHKAAFVAGKPQHSLGLLDGLTKAARRKVDLATVTLSGVIAEPVLQERRAEKRLASPAQHLHVDKPTSTALGTGN